MSIVASLIGFNILILVHELGHYFAARCVGLRAERVSIGFGPTLMAWNGVHTEYRLALFPLGGYVRFPPNEAVYGTQRTYRDDGLRALGRWSRFFVISAGPLANVLLAFVAYAMLFASDSAVIYQFKRMDSNHLGAVQNEASRQGFKTGDFIVAVNERSTSSFDEVIDALSRSKQNTTVVVLRPSDPEALRFDSRRSRIGGLEEYWPEPSGDASRIVIVLLDRKAVLQFVSHVKPTVVRWGGTTQWQSIRHGGREIVAVLKAMQILISGWIAGETEPEIKSVVGMTKLSAESYEKGLQWFITLLALFSMNLAILNLLPLPGLDGGRLLLDGLEWISGRPLPPKLTFWIHGLGMLVILTFIVAVMASESIDLLR